MEYLVFIRDIVRYVDADTPRKARAEFRKQFGKKLKLTEAEMTDDSLLEVRTTSGKVVVSQPALTRTSTYDDSQFIRTALIVSMGGEGGSVDVITPDGKRLCQINIFVSEKNSIVENVIVDAIDVDDQFSNRAAITFPGKKRKSIKAGQIVSADFKK